jgi:hypothetical protein
MIKPEDDFTVADALEDATNEQLIAELRHRNWGIVPHQGDAIHRKHLQVMPPQTETVPKNWHGLMQILNDIYPETIFPTKPDNQDRDIGPRIISLCRQLNELTQQHDQQPDRQQTNR